MIIFGENAADDDRKYRRIFFWAASLFVSVMAAALFLFVSGLIGGETLGQFGGFVGGLTNPALSTLAILVLVMTVGMQSQQLKLQREELHLTRDELSRSAAALEDQNKSNAKRALESAFFDMFGVYNSIVSSTEVVLVSGRCKNGKDAFSRMARDLKDDFSQSGGSEEIELENIVNTYSAHYLKNKSKLSHYYRYI